jgi:predicted GNAT family acetyltransferase
MTLLDSNNLQGPGKCQEVNVKSRDGRGAFWNKGSMNIAGEIRWHLGDNYARLKYSESKEAFSIDMLLVPAAHRQKGIATSLINYVLLLADALNKNVYVAARPLGHSNQGFQGENNSAFILKGLEILARVFPQTKANHINMLGAPP